MEIRMQIILSDHNCEGQAKAIFQALDQHGFLPTFPMALTSFLKVGLHPKASDREVWQFCQDNGYLLLTGNRTAADGKRSLEYVINTLLKEDSLPVITIGNLDHVMADPTYCWRCAENLAEIILDLDRVRGTPRLYIPGHAVSR
jgi:hypothetical protein